MWVLIQAAKFVGKITFLRKCTLLCDYELCSRASHVLTVSWLSVWKLQILTPHIINTIHVVTKKLWHMIKLATLVLCKVYCESAYSVFVHMKYSRTNHFSICYLFIYMPIIRRQLQVKPFAAFSSIIATMLYILQQRDFTAWRYASVVYAIILCLSVCLYVCRSHFDIVSKWLNIESCTIAHRLIFWCQRSHRNSEGIIHYRGTKHRWGRLKSATFDK